MFLLVLRLKLQVVNSVLFLLCLMQAWATGWNMSICKNHAQQTLQVFQ